MKTKNLILTISLTLLFLPLFSSPLLLAQEDPQVMYEEEQEEVSETVIDENSKSGTNRYFDLTIERKPQSPFGQHVPYILTVTPHIDSPKTQILWNVPTTIKVKRKHKEFNALKSGQTYVFEGKITPLRAGTYDFSITVISWQHDTNYTNSISDNVEFNKALVLQPVSSQYKALNTIKIILITLISLGIVVGAALIVTKYTQKAKQWLTPPT